MTAKIVPLLFLRTTFFSLKKERKRIFASYIGGAFYPVYTMK